MSPEGHEPWLGEVTRLHIDIGTGDGTFALRMARQCPDIAVIGLDTNLDNLTKAARRPQPNLRFMTGDALTPPYWLLGRADSVSINFPYGALLHAIAREDDGLECILGVARTGACVDIRVNASAGASYNVPMVCIRWQMERALRRLAPRSTSISIVSSDAFRSFPSTWAKRLAYGQPSEVLIASAVLGE
jgi:hypothetical protein